MLKTPKFLMNLDLQYGAMSDKCKDCLFCVTREFNRDQKSCILTGFIVNPGEHHTQCPATFAELDENGDVKQWQP